MRTRKQVLLPSACAVVILLTGMAIILPATTTEEPAGTETTTALITVVWWAISVIGGLLILALIAAGSFAMMKKRKVPLEGSEVKKVTGSGMAAKEKARATAGAVAAVIVIIVGIAYGWPAFWEWWRNQSFLFWWTVLALPALAVVATKFKSAWWLVIGGVVIALLAADWITIPNPLDWRQPNLATAKDAAAKRQAARPAMSIKPSATRSRVTTKTIVARPDGWSEFIWIPPRHNYQGEATGCIQIKNGLGAIFNYCPGDKLTLSKNGTPPEGQFTFRSLTEGPVEVYVEWGPK